jgi:predicted permease
MARAGRRRLFANSLMIAQIALAVLMLAGAALLVRTLVNLRRTPTGFEARNLLLFALDPVSARYADSAIASLYRTIRQRLEILPGVRGVTYSTRPLLSGGLSSTGVRIETRSDLGEVPLKVLRVGADYFSTMSIPLIAGRDFTAGEFVTDRPVALVNRAFADWYVHGKMPLGFHYGDDSKKGLTTEIVGVVADTRYESLREPMAPTAFEPLRGGATFFAVRTAGDSASLIPAVRKLVREIDPNLPVFKLKTQQTQIDEGLFVERLITQLAVAFGLLALILTSTGLYGLLSYEVARRTREIGIRIAVGAAPHAVQAGVFREMLAIVTVGLAVGLPCALLATRALSGLLYGVAPNDPLILGAVAALLLCVTSLAAYLPARRASRVDPLVALRCD